jgi:hypothetical protein
MFLGHIPTLLAACSQPRFCDEFVVAETSATPQSLI